jgi:hypothetical protein
VWPHFLRPAVVLKNSSFHQVINLPAKTHCTKAEAVQLPRLHRLEAARPGCICPCMSFSEVWSADKWIKGGATETRSMHVKSRRCRRANCLNIKVVSFFVRPDVGRTNILMYLKIEVVTMYDVSNYRSRY